MVIKIILRGLRYGTAFLCCALGLTSIVATGGGGGGGSDYGPAPFSIFFSVDIVDLDGDGHLDIASARTDIWHSPPHEGRVSLLYQHDQLPWPLALRRLVNTGGDPVCIATGDPNRDGLVDIATANSSTNDVSILYQDPLGGGDFLPSRSISVGYSPTFLKIGDVDEDGFDDLVISGSNTSILFQNSNSPGTFLPVVNLGIGSTSVDIGDINGDSHLDLALSGWGLDGTQIHLLFQDSSSLGNFLPAVSLTTGFQPFSIKIADIDIDGKADLIVGNHGKADDPRSGSVSVFIQDSLAVGTFLPRIDYPLGRRVEDLAIGDLNNDGFEDIAVANGYTGPDSRGSISILFQNDSSLGNFLSPVFYEGIYQPVSIAVGDLNGDSFTDIAFGADIVAIRFQDITSPGNFGEIIIVDVGLMPLPS